MKGRVKIGNREYDCEVINGERYIDGLPASEFLDRLPIEEVMKFALTGAIKIDCDESKISVPATDIYSSLDKKPN